MAGHDKNQTRIDEEILASHGGACLAGCMGLDPGHGQAELLAANDALDKLAAKCLKMKLAGWSG